MCVTFVGEVILHDGHQCGHLTEEQNAMIGHLQFRQDSVEQLEFARRTVQISPRQPTAVQSFASNIAMHLPHADAAGIVEMPADLLLQLVEDERMVADLSQLHDGVHQRFRIGSLAVLKARDETSPTLHHSAYWIFGHEHSAALHLIVHHSLQCRHITFDHVFDFVR